MSKKKPLNCDDVINLLDTAYRDDSMLNVLKIKLQFP